MQTIRKLPLQNRLQGSSDTKLVFIMNYLTFRTQYVITFANYSTAIVHEFSNHKSDFKSQIRVEIIWTDCKGVVPLNIYCALVYCAIHVNFSRSLNLVP